MLVQLCDGTYRRIGHAPPGHGFGTAVGRRIPPRKAPGAGRDGAMQPRGPLGPHHLVWRVHTRKRLNTAA